MCVNDAAEPPSPSLRTLGNQANGALATLEDGKQQGKGDTVKDFSAQHFSIRRNREVLGMESVQVFEALPWAYPHCQSAG